LVNATIRDGLTADEHKEVDNATEVAVGSGLGISHVIEASSGKDQSSLGKKMTNNSAPPVESKTFAAIAQSAVRKVIEEQPGAEGAAMRNAMLTRYRQGCQLNGEGDA